MTVDRKRLRELAMAAPAFTARELWILRGIVAGKQNAEEPNADPR